MGQFIYTIGTDRETKGETTMTNLKEKAIQDLLEEGTKHGQTAVMLDAALHQVSDMNLFAFYVEVFGHPVGQETVRS